MCIQYISFVSDTKPAVTGSITTNGAMGFAGMGE